MITLNHDQKTTRVKEEISIIRELILEEYKGICLQGPRRATVPWERKIKRVNFYARPPV